MAKDCSGECASCGEECADRKDIKESLAADLHELSSVKRVIGVVSGKGGVGKSLVTAMLAVSANRMGLKTAVLDADVTGPSIPKMFGVRDKAENNGLGICPAKSVTGIEIMSVNLLLENDSDPAVWRGPSQAARQGSSGRM